ncbi:MAG: tetratricopeptide repeat protein, partial [Duncaniella sp.]|nr:tetratricopeptide repeat protein [Duncaniella sp.]
KSAAGEDDSADKGVFPELTAENSETQEQGKTRFTSLTTIDDNTRDDRVFNNKNIRGKVQNRNVTVELEPMFVVTYYTSPTELKQSGDYIREVDDLNYTRMLRYLLQVTNHEPSMSDEDAIQSHFSSIEYYNSYLATHTPRAIDYFGRAMDFMTTRNYPAAIDDLNRAIALTPDFTVAYLVRSYARYCDRGNPSADGDSQVPEQAKNMRTMRSDMQGVIDDLDMVIKLSPEMAVAYYNKGVVLAELQDYTGAISAFTKALQLRPDLGEAYYNRGYSYLRLGNKDFGVADLSKAGELGIVPSYNLLKRMNR